MATIEKKSFTMNLQGLIALVTSVGIIVSAYFLKTGTITNSIEAINKKVETDLSLQYQYRITDSLKYVVIQLQIDQLKNDIQVDRQLLMPAK